jgi:hypothetical protein
MGSCQRPQPESDQQVIQGRASGRNLGQRASRMGCFELLPEPPVLPLMKFEVGVQPAEKPHQIGDVVLGALPGHRDRRLAVTEHLRRAIPPVVDEILGALDVEVG